MTSGTQLPPFLADAWTLDDSSLHQAAADDSIDQWNVTSLCENQIEWQVQEHDRLLTEHELSFHALGKNVTPQGPIGTATLASHCNSKIIRLLEESNDVSGDITMLAKCLNWTSIRDILCDPRLPYPLLRSFLRFLPADESTDAVNTAKAVVDIDELIIANERYIRSRGPERNKDDKYLVRFERPETLFLDAREDRSNNQLIITRKDPPKGGLELFDLRRPRQLGIQLDRDTFVRTFNRITKDVLQGLNWQNVFVAGGIVLTTLLHIDPAKDTEKKVQDGDIDIYLYGLNPQEANDKVRELYHVWSQNLPSDNRQILVVKTPKTITFLSDYPNRRLQIILKLVPSPTAILLNFDLDPCAMGFDGTDVFMLPRAARCLETGYTTFTMDLILGHHLHVRQATRLTRLLKYGHRGFGIRILPSYVRVLEDACLPGTGRPDVKDHTTQLESSKRSRQEPGLKTLKRIAYMGKDFVHRKCFGITELPIRADGLFDAETFRKYVDKQRRKKARIDSRRAAGQKVQTPVLYLEDLDLGSLFEECPKIELRVHDFDLWMRYHEAWRLDMTGEAMLEKTVMNTSEYDALLYDDLPGYAWNEYFDASQYSYSIDVHNDQIFEEIKQDICDMLGIPLQRTGWRDYLTRRIRRAVHGANISSVFEKQITLPLVIPHDLEACLERQMGNALSQAQPTLPMSQDRLLIPVHEMGQGTIVLPDLQDQAGSSGNMRYWVIGNELMWAGIHRRLDEVAEVLRILFSWSRASRMDFVSPTRPISRLDQRAALMFVAKRFRERITPSCDGLAFKDNGGRIRSSATGAIPSTRTGNVPEREARLFQQWVLHRHRFAPVGAIQDLNTRTIGDILVADDVVKYPPPDELFWRDGEEATDP